MEHSEDKQEISSISLNSWHCVFHTLGIKWILVFVVVAAVVPSLNRV